MSASDKSKLNGITSSADSVSFSRSLNSGTKIGTLTINGTGTDLYCQTNTITNYYHTRAYSSGLKISTGTGVSDMYVPNATTSQAGVVSTATQSFAGTKTFTANTTHYNTLLESTNSIAYWGNPTLNMGLSANTLYIAGEDNSGAVDLGSSIRRWKGLYIAGNVNSGGYDVIKNYNNGNITVNAASKILYLGYTTTTQIISYQNHSVSGYLKVNSTAVAEYALDVNGTIKFTKRLIGASGTDSVYGSSLPAKKDSTTGQIFFKIG